MEAQRFPEDYDGIIAGAPAYRWTGLFTDFVWNAQACRNPERRFLRPRRLRSLEQCSRNVMRRMGSQTDW